MAMVGEHETLVLSVAEAARQLDISLGTAYTLCREGRLPSIRLSTRRLVIPRKSLDLLLEGKMQPV